MKFCVIGLGTFGKSLARSLAQLGAEVMALDTKEDNINQIMDDVSFAAVVDGTDLTSMRKLPLQEMDAVLVAIGEGFEASLLITAHLQELKVNRIICRVVNPVHEKLLKLMNITERIVPESVAASRLAKSLTFTGVINTFELSEGYSIVEAMAPARMLGKTLLDADLRRRFNLNLITVRQTGAIPTSNPQDLGHILGIIPPDYRFRKGDILVLFGREKDIRGMLED
ncbi:MAG: TrkA family potassium uptake protein [Verrucomicrobiota bacterium]|nr:TrkA family potassium uptake protein [Verrucomicrobiota bacterium]